MTKDDIKDYKDLLVWQKSKEIAVIVYQVTKDFPRSEQFGLISQIRRAAVSIPSNIAEGHTRQHTREFIQFLYMALGSSSEVETQLIISLELKYLKQEEFDKLVSRLVEVRKMLNGLIGALRERTKA